MKVIVKVVFFDNAGVHKVGDIIDVDNFDERRMELVEDKKPAPKKIAKK